MKPQQPPSLGLWGTGDESEVGGWNNVSPSLTPMPLPGRLRDQLQGLENWLHPFPVPREARTEEKSPISEDLFASRFFCLPPLPQ